MFKKPFSCNGNTKLKKALLKKVRIATGKSLELFDELPQEEIAKLIPSKAEAFEVTKLKGSRVGFYSYKDCPVFIDVNGKGNIIPTVFGMWLVPDQMLTLKVDNGAFPHILNGADLMAPGVQLKLEDFPDFEADQPIGIAVPCGKVIAVGYTLKSSAELKKNGKTGKLVRVEHYLGDHLFLHIWKTSPSPHCSLPEDLEHLHDLLKLPARATISQELVEEAEPEEEKQEDEKQEDQEVPASEETPNEENIEEEEEEDEEQTPEVREKLTMEELLKMSFLQGIKTSLSSDDLPIIGSVFYSLHMQPNRPRGFKLDIKRSSYKKLVRFLQAMAREEIITIKPLPKGEVQILKINDKHADYIEFSPYKTESGKKSAEQSGKQKSSKSDEKTFTITKLLRPTADLFPVFAEVIEDAQKTQLYTRKEAVDTLWKYVAEKVVSKPGSSDVELDTALSRGAFRKQKKEGTVVTKEELATRFVAALQENYEIRRDDVVTVVKGCLEPVISREERRGGHKYVTRIKGVETYLLDPKDISKALRKKFAASATVSDLPMGKGKGGPTPQEIVIQGKMNHQIKNYLCKEYQIPAKNIELFSK